ncbi:MAG: hypothetical protein Hyperionvirus4_69 [Hyperionvirus sp.]|uniref:Uncharacterized protein n=1 Tax=Hyperionvirus sp. TaxID=2487770 RepID=A0A3G5A9E4_9VIRU|nr:MAG: hypothetical protein Hyperionvirus4_69 [Hyperionvirus sp.]
MNCYYCKKGCCSNIKQTDGPYCEGCFELVLIPMLKLSMNQKMNQKMKHARPKGAHPLREGVDALASGDLSGDDE